LHCFRWAEVHAFFEAKPSIMTPFSACVNDRLKKFPMPHEKARLTPASKSQGLPASAALCFVFATLGVRFRGS
jgi:hypothetical protein